MTTWSAEAQAQSLKYGAYVSLISGLYFGIMLVNKWLKQAGIDTGEWPRVLLVLVALLFIGIVTRLSVNNYKLCGGWREIFGLYSDEFTRETSRKANARAFVGLLVVLIPGFMLGEKAASGGLIATYLNVSTFSLLLIVIGTMVWSFTVLWELRDSADDQHG
ncbi:MAG: Uncharacterised protein [Pseudidiomarina mangrovi]|nr:MAG: Uncharacterised protein [Pseudidiomarina mangrovi]